MNTITLIKAIIIGAFFAVANLCVAGAEIGANELSSNTRAEVREVFGHDNLNWDQTLKIKIANKNAEKKENGMVDVGNNELIMLQFRYQEMGANTDKIAVFIEGNNKPLVAVIEPGESLKSHTISISGIADSECDKYKALVVIKQNDKLIANWLPFRTIVGDCYP